MGSERYRQTFPQILPFISYRARLLPENLDDGTR